MSAGAIRLDDIYYAISELERAAEREYSRAKGWQEYETAKGMRRAAQDAQREYAQLSKVWSDFLAFDRQRAVSYDRYVERDREPECCSCHLNAPCSFCMMQVDEEAEEDAK